MGFVVGGLLWGLWGLLWRAPSCPVVLPGLAFPSGIRVFPAPEGFPWAFL